MASVRDACVPRRLPRHRFVASDEAWIHPLYKQFVVESRAEDTFYGELFDFG